MPPSVQRELATAAAALRQAAQLCRRVGRQIAPDVLEKRDRSPVTVADFGSQALVCRRLADVFPGDPVVAEEDSAGLRTRENAPLLEQVVEHVRRFHPSADVEDVCRWIDHGGGATAGLPSSAGEGESTVGQANRGIRGSSPQRATPESSTGGQAARGTRFWTLDPIDGTKGFLRGEQYAIALALLIDGQVELAALACPNLGSTPNQTGSVGRLFLAARGQGCWVEPIDGVAGSERSEGPEDSGAKPTRPSLRPERTILRVSECSGPKAARVCESVEAAHSSHDDAARVAEHLGIATDPVRLDSQAKYGIVAAGEAEIYLRLPTRADYREKIWDHAAGALLVAEAGGTVTDVAGKPLEFHHGRELSANRGVIATNGHLHEQVLAALRVVGIA